MLVLQKSLAEHLAGAEPDDLLPHGNGSGMESRRAAVRRRRERTWELRTPGE